MAGIGIVTGITVDDVGFGAISTNYGNTRARSRRKAIVDKAIADIRKTTGVVNRNTAIAVVDVSAHYSRRCIFGNENAPAVRPWVGL